MNLQMMALGALLSLVVGFTSGWKVNTWKHESERLVEAQTFTNAMEMAAKELAKIEVKNVTIRQKVLREVLQKEVYRDCTHSEEALQNINRAILNSEE